MNAERNYVFVGVSLQGKDNSKEQFSRLIEYSQEQYNMSKIAFLVADEIELINQRVFYTGHENSYRARVEKMALEIEASISSACHNSLLNSGRLCIYRWRDILDNAYWNKYFRLKHLFIHSIDFRNDVLREIKEYAYGRLRKISENELLYLCDYVLHELPTLIHGISVGGVLFNRMIYPAPETANIDKIAINLRNNAYGDIQLSPPYCVIDKYIYSGITENKTM
jgi:tRNA-dependent cyclodipeptide synthase